MGRKKDVVDYHAVPRAERGLHTLDGHECKCEPRCVLTGDAFRLFLHQPELIDIVRATPKPKGLLGPGPTL